MVIFTSAPGMMFATDLGEDVGPLLVEQGRRWPAFARGFVDGAGFLALLDVAAHGGRRRAWSCRRPRRCAGGGKCRRLRSCPERVLEFLRDGDPRQESADSALTSVCFSGHGPCALMRAPGVFRPAAAAAGVTGSKARKAAATVMTMADLRIAISFDAEMPPGRESFQGRAALRINDT